MRKILVTGASGFIGRHTLRTLVEHEFDVHAVTAGKLTPALPGCRWHRVDLLDPVQIKNLLRDVQPAYLLHFAWDVIPGRYWTSINNFSWVQASLGLLQSFQEQGGQRVVMAGTCAEYDWSHGYCREFITPKLPTTAYGICKHSLQVMLEAYTRETGLSSAWGRIFLNYGPHEYPVRLIPSVILSLLRGEPARCSHGSQIRDFLYVQDAAEAFVALLESNVSGPVNIASGQPVTIKFVINEIARQIGRSGLIEFGAVKPPEHEPEVLFGDIQRLSNEVGWVPKYSLEFGIQHTINWWSRNLKIQLVEKVTL
ncbi:NAD-dependent epimerase/dehydratase family protein [Phosphitispora fastidiosa]|uniref:NAD-dependent epimerase/dehydratase family protein n=1 Tax=Phosphitispora fastidiosa TaxID=2837202 RepID=UPI001E4934EA|nr:NAD(P)-dependent oxidoreductase [Phosphitispora fastidiosa]MBU7008563.1 nucleoside-diphosphate-sugar epimerase [Phosphitispora fastidiosa]